MPEPICSECKQPTIPHLVDESFSHEFGIEKHIYIESTCCQGYAMINGKAMNEVDYKNYMGYTYGT